MCNKQQRTNNEQRTRKSWLLRCALSVMVMVTVFSGSVFAQEGEAPSNTKKQEAQAVQKQLSDENTINLLHRINKKANLPSFYYQTHRNATPARGARSITSAVLFAVDLAKYLLGGVAILYLIFGALQIIFSGKNVEEIYNKQKDSLTYILIGFLVIMVSDVAVTRVFFGQSGEAFADEASAKFFAQQGANAVKGIYSAAQYVAASIALVFIVYYGIKMVAASSNEETVNESRKNVIYAVIGLFIIGISELFVKEILFKNDGSTLGISNAKALIKGVTNFIASFIGLFAFVMLIYAGFLYVAGAGEEESNNKAKTIIKGSIFGMIIAMAAFAFANTLIDFVI